MAFKHTSLCIALLGASLVLTACGGGGGGGGGGSAGPVLTGQFVDSAVSGVAYQTATLNGVTDANGNRTRRVSDSGANGTPDLIETYSHQPTTGWAPFFNVN